MRIAAALAFVALLTSPTLSQAAPTQAEPVQATGAIIYTIDPDHTRVGYSISHLGFSMFPGHFNGVSGTILFDPTHVENARVDVTIDAKSVSMDNAALDKKLAAAPFFDTDHFPTIRFVSTSVQKTGPATGVLIGNATLLGVTKPVTLDVTFNKQGLNKYMAVNQVGFSATGLLRRSDFGMNAYIPDVGDEVHLSIQVEASQHRVPEKTINSDK